MVIFNKTKKTLFVRNKSQKNVYVYIEINPSIYK